MDKKLADDSKKSSKKSNRESTKVEPAYIRDLPPWMMEDPKGGGGNKTKHRKEYWWCNEHRAGKGQWVFHKPEHHGNWTSTSSNSGGCTN